MVAVHRRKPAPKLWIRAGRGPTLLVVCLRSSARWAIRRGCSSLCAISTSWCAIASSLATIPSLLAWRAVLLLTRRGCSVALLLLTAGGWGAVSSIPLLGKGSAAATAVATV